MTAMLTTSAHMLKTSKFLTHQKHSWKILAMNFMTYRFQISPSTKKTQQIVVFPKEFQLPVIKSGNGQFAMEVSRSEHLQKIVDLTLKPRFWMFLIHVFHAFPWKTPQFSMVFFVDPWFAMILQVQFSPNGYKIITASSVPGKHQLHRNSSWRVDHIHENSWLLMVNHWLMMVDWLVVWNIFIYINHIH